ncbi:MAG: ferredoxin:thioredoxin reductase [Nanoarchaeota archaeon]|nr:ferredoxin:thioredoxin reductase [Nanoarchaeota archaeon]
MESEELRKSWEDFTQNNDFKLNPDKKHVDFIIEGVLENEKKHGLKLCPCRLRDGTREKDLELICPCNFKTHETWLKPKNKPQMCWCGLFVKK